MNNWRTKDGTLIPIQELDDNHLSNIIKMLWRWKRRKKIRQDLAAGDAADADMTTVMSASDVFFSSEKNLKLLREGCERGLHLPAQIWDEFFKRFPRD